MTLQEFLTQTQSEVRAQVSEQMTAGGYLRAEEAFTDIVMQHMAENGMTFDPKPLHVEKKAGNAVLRLSGYAVSDSGEQLDLFVSCYSGDDEVKSITDTEIKTAAEQCIRFLDRAASGKLSPAVDPSDDVYELTLTIQECYAELDQVRIYVLSDRQAKSKRFKPRDIAGKSVRLEVMDIERLHRHWSEGKPRDELIVSFEEECGTALPCVYFPSDGEDYDYALTAIPGTVLRSIYERYGAQLLEANVRSFLSQSGKVNMGIRDTLRDAPERFMAYNNGIVLIADGAGLGRTADGSAGITWLKGMQIVNGGQTTASLYFTKRKYPDIDLAKVRVPAKIIVLHAHDPDTEERLVTDISRYANSQNTVKFSDLSANKPFHVDLEKLALTTFCPDGTSRWFYERAAGSYNVMLLREGTTPAKLKQLKDAIPPARRFTKTDLAKYSNAWLARPHIVALGSQKNFAKFMADLADNPPSLDVTAYKRLVAQILLFKAVHKAVLSDYQSFQANITAYTVSVLALRLGSQLSLDSIWLRQGVSPQLLRYASEVASTVNNVLRDSAGARMISEWAKKEECWSAVSSHNYADPPKGIPELA